MGTLGCRDEKLRIESVVPSACQILENQRVHVVNQEVGMDLVTRDTQVASKITSDDVLTSVPPLARVVEPLI